MTTGHRTGTRLILVATILTLSATTTLAGPVPSEAPPPACGERYYVILFGGMAKWWRPKTAHTWATFVRSQPAPDGTTRIDSFTISWLPADLNVRPWAVRAVQGMNVPLHQTLEIMCTGQSSISLWGPYEIHRERYSRAAEYKQLLDSGAILYRVLDGAPLGIPANHCVRAVTFGDPELHRATTPQLWFGELITRKVAFGMLESGMLVDPSTKHDWLIPALGIDPHPLTPRNFSDPAREFVLGRR
jgi:hypothetical protein